MLFVVCVALLQDGRDSKVGEVGVDGVGAVWLGDGEYGGGGEVGLELVEGGGAGSIPSPGYILLQEVGQGAGFGGILLHEIPVVPCETQEAAHLGAGGGLE